MGEGQSHANLFHVVEKPGFHASYLEALKPFSAGETICSITGTTTGPKRWSSVQIGQDMHIELNSDLVYINHSCNPSVEFSLEPGKTENPIGVIRAARDVAKGEALTFFYPSTEWDMDRPFDCHCGENTCFKTIQGAKYIPQEKLERYHLNSHIQYLLQNKTVSK